jgi:hypothetical protein
LGRRNAFRLEGLFIFLHVRHVREEKEEEEHDGRIKKEHNYKAVLVGNKKKRTKIFFKIQTSRPFYFLKNYRPQRIG